MSQNRRVNQHGRSKYDAVHVRIYSYELSSPAYRMLSCTARALYVEIKSYHNGQNNGEIYMSVRMAADRLGVSKNTANAALKQLQEHGFITPHIKGTFSRKVRHATTWVLSEYPFKDKLPMRNYKSWSPSKKNKKRSDILNGLSQFVGQSVTSEGKAPSPLVPSVFDIAPDSVASMAELGTQITPWGTGR